MTWTRLSDDFSDRPALLSLGRSARLLHVEALVYCNRMLTDGGLPRGALGRITDSPDVAADVAELVAAGLWVATDTGWELDWSDQENAATVAARREDHKARQATYRERGERHNRGDHSLCTKNCPYRRSDVSRDASGDTAVTRARPVPSRPKRERDRDMGATRPPLEAAGATRPAAQPPEEHLPDGGLLIHMTTRPEEDDW